MSLRADLERWVESLSPVERQLFILLILFFIINSIFYVLYRNNFVIYSLTVGFSILFFSIFIGYLILPRRPRVVSLYDDQRPYYNQYSDLEKEDEPIEQINLTDLDRKSEKYFSRKPKNTKSQACFYCKTIELLPYVCKYCGYSYCSNHRLPERHNCPGIK